MIDLAEQRSQIELTIRLERAGHELSQSARAVRRRIGIAAQLDTPWVIGDGVLERELERVNVVLDQLVQLLPTDST